MRFKLIACELLCREFCEAVAQSPHAVDVEFLSKGLHDRGAKAMRAELQERIDATDDPSYSAILLGYALCGNGLHGVIARSLRLVAPRAHDCIGLLMGSAKRYQEYADATIGVYYRSTGWLERGNDLEQLAPQREALICKYGEDNGEYLFQELYRYRTTYRQLTFIETGLEPNGEFEERARREAADRKWRFEKLRGDLGLFHRLVAGDWDDAEFLIVEPGWRIVARYDEGIIGCERDSA